jgi:inner membrane protein
MLYRTHLILTFVIVLIFVPYLENKLFFILIALISCGIPDIDSQSSKYGRKIIFRPLQFFIKHRGFFHSLMFLLIVYSALLMFVPKISFGFLIGFLSHVFGDMLTKEGVKLFWPINYRFYGFIKTGGFFENVLFFILGILSIVLILFYS